MPERIQLSRARGWRLPPGARSVARPGPYGNPFGVEDDFARGHPLRRYLDAAVLEVTGVDPAEYGVIQPHLRPVAVAAHRLWLEDQPELVERARAELRCLDLACWCELPDPGEPDHCHGRTWLCVVNDLEVPGDA